MDHSDLTKWKKFLTSLEESSSSLEVKTLKEFSLLLEHLSPEVPPRLKKEYDSCVQKTYNCLRDMFDILDLSNKSLLAAYIKLLTSFGYFRMSQITFAQDTHSEATEVSLFFPLIKKTKWYDMTPLLPEAGTIGWKMILLHGLVREERELMQTCLNLCIQKLHFYAILTKMDKYEKFSHDIQKCGQKVSEKLLELIRDAGYDDESLVGINSQLFSLLLCFVNEPQRDLILDAVIQDMFKPHQLQRPIRESSIENLYSLIRTHIIVKTDLQNAFVDKLLDHMKCNIIRRKRRHSMDMNGDTKETSLEGLIDSVRCGEKLSTILLKIEGFQISAKGLQARYVSYWVEVLTRILPEGYLTPINSMKLFTTCSVILITTIEVATPDLVNDMCGILTKTIDSTIRGLDGFLKYCSPVFLMQLTKTICERTQLLSTFNTPIQNLYSSYLRRYLKFGSFRGNKFDTTDLVQFVDFICDKNLKRGTSHYLQYIFIKEMADCLESNKFKCANQVLDSYMVCSKKCANNLFRFIKRNMHRVIETRRDDGDVDMLDPDSSSETYETSLKKMVIIDALTSIVRIAILRHDQEILDVYSDLLLKLYSSVEYEVSHLNEVVQSGTFNPTRPLTAHLSKLMKLYVGHKDLIKPYLNSDLVDTVSCVIFASNCYAEQVENGIKLRKIHYGQVRKKLKTLSEQAAKSDQVYQTIINKQYNLIIDPSLGTDLEGEKLCCQSYLKQINILCSVSSTVLENCSLETYKSSLNNLATSLEQCDALDHCKVLHSFVLIESCIVKSEGKETPKMDIFKDILPRFLCSMMRIAKIVELGPSIHAFTKSLSHKSSRAIHCCTYSSCVKLVTIIVTKCPTKITQSIIPTALDLCISSNLYLYAKHSSKLQGFFIQLAYAISNLMQSISFIMRDKEVFKSSLPTFLTTFSQLIGCVILASDKRQLDSSRNNNLTNGLGSVTPANEELNEEQDLLSKDYESQLELLALDIGRTLNNLSSFRVKLVDYAPHLITAYIKDIQQASCPDSVRTHLNEGIFRIFNLIDAHQREREGDIFEGGSQRKINASRAGGSLLEMIHARLDQASREIFRDMHENYNRFHRYLGKC